MHGGLPDERAGPADAAGGTLSERKGFPKGRWFFAAGLFSRSIFAGGKSAGLEKAAESLNKGREIFQMGQMAGIGDNEKLGGRELVSHGLGESDIGGVFGAGDEEDGQAQFWKAVPDRGNRALAKLAEAGGKAGRAEAQTAGVHRGAPFGGEAGLGGDEWAALPLVEERRDTLGENVGGETFVRRLAGGAFGGFGQAGGSGNENEGVPMAGMGQGVAQGQTATQRVAEEDGGGAGWGGRKCIQILDTSGGVAVVAGRAGGGGIGSVAGEVGGAPGQFREGVHKRGEVRAAAGEAVQGEAERRRRRGGHGGRIAEC